MSTKSPALPKSRHLLCEYRGCDSAVLNDTAAIRELLEAAASEAGATVIGTHVNAFAPQGVTCVVLLRESHLSIHTWPEHGYAAVDFFSCGPCEQLLAQQRIAQGLRATQCETMAIERGDRITVASHD